MWASGHWHYEHTLYSRQLLKRDRSFYLTIVFCNHNLFKCNYYHSNHWLMHLLIMMNSLINWLMLIQIDEDILFICFIQYLNYTYNNATVVKTKVKVILFNLGLFFVVQTNVGIGPCFVMVCILPWRGSFEPQLVLNHFQKTNYNVNCCAQLATLTPTLTKEHTSHI